MAKKWFLCLTKTLERPSILHAIHNLICFNCSDVESVAREKNKKNKQTENINKFYTDWTVCDKAISSQSIIIT